ncbi:molybdopterin-dependent oxidoreductase, partial [Myxococcota bacterium]|nr:molybdopterin-dependent oxidoreductase [Myxococcota bacterium]
TVASLSLFSSSCDHPEQTDTPPDIPPDPTPVKPPRENSVLGKFPFHPNGPEDASPVTWPVRTVDLQDLDAIINSWTLKVGVKGMRALKTYTFKQLVALPRTNMLVDFHCVEGWSVQDIAWNGVHPSTILEDMGYGPRHPYVTFHTIGGRYNESLPVEQALEPKTLLAYGVGGYTLPLKRGFPLRLVIPKLLAYKSAKYVDTIEFAKEKENGFWVARGYPYEAVVSEDRLREGKY